MSDIKRYQPITDIYGRAKMEKDPAGDYVDADDYERLRAELADARQEVVALRATEDNLRAEVERLRQQVAQIDPQEVMRLADEYARLCENWTTNGSYKDAVEKARVALARAVGSKE